MMMKKKKLLKKKIKKWNIVFQLVMHLMTSESSTIHPHSSPLLIQSTHPLSFIYTHPSPPSTSSTLIFPSLVIPSHPSKMMPSKTHPSTCFFLEIVANSPNPSDGKPFISVELLQKLKQFSALDSSVSLVRKKERNNRQREEEEFALYIFPSKKKKKTKNSESYIYKNILVSPLWWRYHSSYLCHFLRLDPLPWRRL